MEIRYTKTFVDSIEKIRRSRYPIYFAFWKNLYHDAKQSLRSIFAYLKITPKMRDWDYAYILGMMRFQIKRLHDHVENHSQEIEKDRYKKLEQMERAIELLDGMIEDDYLEKAGWNEKNYSSFSEALDDMDRYIDESYRIQKKEWEALWKLISNCMGGWWD